MAKKKPVVAPKPPVRQQQSPIRIYPSRTYYAPALRDEIWIEYPDRMYGLPGDDDHSDVFLQEPQDGFVTVRGARCRLQRLHFHSHPEHRIVGKRADYEVHFVHEIPPTNDPVLKDASMNVVVGVLLRFVKGAPTPQALRDLSLAVGQKRTEKAAGKKSEKKVIAFDPYEMLPPGDQIRDFYRYEGGLTGDPYAEAIRWIVMANVVEVDPEDIKALTDVSTHEARDPQELHRRFVLRSFP